MVSEASVNVIKYIGAEPILIDCCKKTAQMDYKLLQSFLREKCFVDKKRCKLKKGSIVFFPSNFMYPHSIEPIKKGIRHSIVAWIH